MKYDLKKIGRRIAIRRDELDITQYQLAESLNISSTHLSNIERGKKTPGFLLFLDICDKLKVSSDYLIEQKVYVNPGEELNEKLKRCTEEQKMIIDTIADAFTK